MFQNLQKITRKLTLIGVVILLTAVLSMMPAQQTNAAVSLVQTTQANTNGGGSPVAANLNSSATAGNLLVAICGYNASSTLTAPSGFATAINQTGTPTQGIFYKVATGGESTISCAFTGSGGTGTIMLHEFSGLRTLNPLDAVNSTPSTGTSSTASSGSVATRSLSRFISDPI